MTITCFYADLQVHFPAEENPENWTNNFLNNYPLPPPLAGRGTTWQSTLLPCKGETGGGSYFSQNRLLAALFSYFNNFSNNFFSSGSEGRGALVITTFPSRSNTMKRGIPVIL